MPTVRNCLATGRLTTGRLTAERLTTGRLTITTGRLTTGRLTTGRLTTGRLTAEGVGGVHCSHRRPSGRVRRVIPAIELVSGIPRDR
jgi:hypothetical protein